MRPLTFWVPALLGSVALSACADGIEPVPFQGIAGRVRYQGTVPDSTEWVRLAVYRQVPETPLGLLNFVTFSDQLPLDSAAAFAIALDPGTYRWIPVVWKRAGEPLSPASLRVLGWFGGGGAGGNAAPFGPPAPVVVRRDQETGSVSVTADFGSPLTVEEALAVLAAQEAAGAGASAAAEAPE